MYRFALPLLVGGVFLVVTGTAFAQSSPPDPVKQLPAPFSALPDADAWAKLPPLKNPPLPEWVKVLAGPLPKTAAKMLELDYLQRAENPLGAVLSARIRLAVARSLGCKYGEEMALADLRRAGLSDLEIEANPMFRQIPSAERAALAFATKLTTEGHAITDGEFAELLRHYGPEKTTAIVHTVAYANFHNRILLGLGVKGEASIVRPVVMKFDLDASKVSAPVRPSWDDLKSVKGGGLSVRLEWSQADSKELDRILEKQKERTLRIPLPDKAVFEKLPEREQDAAKRILWNTVSSGYQPEMTRAWFACLYAYYDEAKPDRVFTNSAFWVVTRTNDCFY
jgi:alkylhydroperoxidase family enzyme